MKIFIWERIENATDNWHPEGGVMVVAESKERAIEIANVDGTAIQDSEEPIVYDLVGDHEEKVIVFPDTGCC